jgi:acrylyl-CoA reductase (NADPH)
LVIFDCRLAASRHSPIENRKSNMPEALFLDERGGPPQLRDAPDEPLADGEVRVNVAYSGLNYKDALAVTGRGQIIRGAFPFVPGIDLAGTVVESASDAFAEGDVVIGTGWGLGEERPGGYAERQRVPADALVALPEAMTLRQAMTAGTAGLTAALAVMALDEHDFYGATDLAEAGPVVVTGASGAAGSFAVKLLSEAGAEGVAATGSESAHDYLRALGATRLLDRRDLSEGPERPMQSARWAAAVDAVGGATLATLLSEMERHAPVAAFGNAGGHELRATVFPFILRGVSLLGVDSNTCPNARRRVAWQRLDRALTAADYDRLTGRVIPLADVPETADDVLAGRTQGRVLVRV